MPRPWTRSKKLRRACGGNPREARTRHTGRGLVSRRDAGGPKEQAHLSLGQERFTPPCRPRSTDPIDLSVWCGLSRTWGRRRPRAAGLQLRSHAAPSRRDRNQSHPRSARPYPPCSGWLAWRQSPSGSEQYLTRAAAAARTRTQRSGKHLAVHASKLAVQSDFKILRRYRRPLLLRLEHTHRPALEDYVHRATRLGSSRSLNLRIGIMHHFAHRAEALHGVAANKVVDLNELLVGKTEIGLANRHQHVAVIALGPDPESIVGIIGRALAVAALGVHQHRIDDEWIALPLPPRALGTARADKVHRGA